MSGQRLADHHEVVFHPHVHTVYSDGHGTHAQVLRAALRAGVDVVQFTDHNVRVEGIEGYYTHGNRRVLALMGEEIHDRTLGPAERGNHLLVFGAQQELASYAPDPQRLLDAARRAGGLTFLAHPHDPVAPVVGEGAFPWRRWDVHGYHGLELWNAMSEFKSHLRSWGHVLFYAFQFHQVAVAPFAETLRLWDTLTRRGQRVVAIGGSDAHAIPVLGPWKRLFPYEAHFRAVNTHLLLSQSLRGQVEEDRTAIYAALAAGHAFVANDLLGSARGFRFRAQGGAGQALMGDAIALGSGLTLQIRLPERAEVRLLRDGMTVQTWPQADVLAYPIRQPGVYRVEAYRRAWGRRRGWIFSNPIYVRP